jgi:hypothetical protein
VTSYRRNFVPGGSFFFTVNLADRRTRQAWSCAGSGRVAAFLVRQIRQAGDLSYRLGHWSRK